MTPISFVIPSVNNLRYLKNAYTSVRKYAGPEHEIIVLDDASTDGTVEWLRGLTDDNLVIWENTTGNRLGHTITYNIGGKLAKNEIFAILHADMFIGPNYVENALKHLERGVVVSATRIEPPLHPEGKEKIVKDFGMWPETFTETEFVQFVHQEQIQSRDLTTRGIFAPWFMYKEDFLAIGGHDPLFAPFPYEDSDIFQRFVLAGYRLVQSRDALVYHLTCRGHKWTDENVLGKTDSLFERSELRARKNYIRKWNSWIKNDEYHAPIILPRFDTCILLEGVTHLAQIEAFELWTNKIIVEHEHELVMQYIIKEQPDTALNMAERVVSIVDPNLTQHDVYVIINLNNFTSEDYNYVQHLNELLSDFNKEHTIDYGETYQIGNIQLKINRLRDTVNDLIKCPRETVYE